MISLHACSEHHTSCLSIRDSHLPRLCFFNEGEAKCVRCAVAVPGISECRSVFFWEGTLKAIYTVVAIYCIVLQKSSLSFFFFFRKTSLGGVQYRGSTKFYFFPPALYNRFNWPFVRYAQTLCKCNCIDLFFSCIIIKMSFSSWIVAFYWMFCTVFVHTDTDTFMFSKKCWSCCQLWTVQRWQDTRGERDREGVIEPGTWLLQFRECDSTKELQHTTRYIL